MIVAAIDCGTNSIRLLVAKKEKDSLVDIVRLMKIVRLGQDIDKTGMFAEEALERTFEACKEYAKICEQHGAEKIRFVATSATRDAKNREVFLQGVQEILGTKVEVISGDEEATLSFNGALNVLEHEEKNIIKQREEKILVVDIGGGSTEFVSGTDKPEKTISLDMGCVRMTERFLKNGVNEENISKACVVIDDFIKKADEKIDFTKLKCFIGLAGSITTITANHLKLSEYDPQKIHGTKMRFEEAITSCNELIYSDEQARKQMGFLHPKRADVIMGGALVFRQILVYLQNKLHEKTIKFDHVITSENDILDGIALSIKN